MKVLWIINTLFPYPALCLKKNPHVVAGWLNSLAESLSQDKNITLAIATTINVECLKEFSNNKIKYYILPCKNRNKYNKKLENYWEDVINKFQPNVIHIHGTEYAHSLPLFKVRKDIKIVTSIQGLMSVCCNNYLSNIKGYDIIKNITIRDLIKFDNLFQQKNKFYRAGKYEKQIIQKSDYIIGRTTWDYSHISLITDRNKYRFCNESLRSDFYDKVWDYDKCDKNTIFVSQASYPIKGFHFLLKAANFLKEEFPNLRILVAGNNIIDTSTFKKKIKSSGYSKYIRSLIKKYKLNDNVQFLGILNSKQMVDRMLKCNLFVQSSVIENSPNSLGEAMLIGMPCVASNVGGTSDMLIDKKEGFLYQYDDTALLINYIRSVLNNSELAIQIGKNAKKHAIFTHDVDNNTKILIDIYNMMLRSQK